MASNQNLRTRLIEVTGYTNVYLQPPPNSQMIYPCVLIQRVSASIKRADNKAYETKFRYMVTRISKKDDDGAFVKACLEGFENCYYDRSYVAEGLYHDALYIYY